MRYLRVAFLYVTTMLVMMTHVWAAEAGQIEHTQIQFRNSHAEASANLEKKIVTSIQAVSEKLLIGRKVEDVTQNKDRFEQTIRRVFDRVLYGYELNEVEIVPGPTSVVYITVAPWGEVVEKTLVEIEVENIAAEDKVIVLQDLAGIEKEVNEVLVGLPVDAFTWADSVSKAVIREFITAKLPEFRATIEYIPAKEMRVAIRLQPIAPLIRSTEVTLRSQSIPKLLLLPTESVLQQSVDKVDGLPVMFVERHKKLYEHRFLQKANTDKTVHKYDITLQPQFRIGENTQIQVAAEAEKWKIGIEGILDLGRDAKNNTMVRSHIGYEFRPNYDFYVDTQFYPNTLSWRFQPGLGRNFGAHLYGGIKYDIRDSESIGVVRYQPSSDIMMTVEKNADSGYRLIGIRYQLHDYFSAEALNDPDRTWVRLIANL